MVKSVYFIIVHQIMEVDMAQQVVAAGLTIEQALYEFVEREALPGTGIDSAHFWSSLAQLHRQFTPRNQALLAQRALMQERIDDWHQQHGDGRDDPGAYRAFLRQLGYLAEPGPAVSLATTGVDDEIARIAGPQLVVPINNARYALNAANARWGSLYDALYGTDVIAESEGAERGDAYNPERGRQVVAYGRDLLDQLAPLVTGSHHQATAYTLTDGALVVSLDGGQRTVLQTPALLAGYQGRPAQPTAILLRHHGLHLELQFDRDHAIGHRDPAGLKDIVLEAALTTIMDCEDSVAAVDGEDKITVYRHWLGLMQGTLAAPMTKNGQPFTRRLAADRQYLDSHGQAFSLKGRSLMLVRNVGIHMWLDAVTDEQGAPLPEGLLDGLLTSAIALHDLRAVDRPRNSATGAIYIVKPKLHGPEEVAFTNELFAAIEAALGLAPLTLKLGIMDEERRTSVNLQACIGAARQRVVFINTGFLDRTGDEIHTAMHAGAMIPKGQMKSSPWIRAYEQRNVAIGLACGLRGKAQIGKGMWASPDQMALMMAQKGAHPAAGANTAWVPSPTAATLHALHYHREDVAARQLALMAVEPAALDELLQLPVAGDEHQSWSAAMIQGELDNNVQGILGYVVRWINDGIGCSKVPDINQVGLMEDRATLRISSQHLANWLLHGICSREQLEATLQRMAAVVDAQNAGMPGYRSMTPDTGNSLAFAAASELIFAGVQQDNGYTEAILHRYRRAFKLAQ